MWLHNKREIYGMDKEMVKSCQRVSTGPFERLEAYQDANHGGATFMTDWAQAKLAAFPEQGASFEMFKVLQHCITQA